jgi:D-amino-acid oxidase
MDITVLGAGVIGLTTALKLSEAGHTVTIRTWRITPGTTSDKAAAFWSPYRIGEEARTFSWIAETYRTLRDISRIPGSGVSMIPLRKFLKDPADTSDVWWLQAIPGEQYAPLAAGELPPGYTNGWSVDVPLMETPVYLPFLMGRLRSLGVEIRAGEKIEDLLPLLSAGDVVVNCTGLGSRALCRDEALLAVRGQIAVARPFPAQAIFVDADTPIYVVPRADGCIVGGTYERDVWEETPDPDTIQTLLERVPLIMPGTNPGPPLRSYAGLRPYRSSVRLEADAEHPRLIHHYGHGGAGFTLSWGAAASVVDLIRTTQ